MKLLVLWDPQNPQVHVQTFLQALRKIVDLNELTFQKIGHRTSPNASFSMGPLLQEGNAFDRLLWIEGGPLPKDLPDCGIPTACWLVNSHLEPSLKTEIAPRFDLCFTTQKSLTADESCRWLPLVGSGKVVSLSPGLHFVYPDPFPGSFFATMEALDSAAALNKKINRPVLIAPSQAEQPNPLIFDSMRAGIPTCVDHATDLRDLAFASQHLLTYEKASDLPGLLTSLAGDPELLDRVASQAPLIVKHLHSPELRAQQLVDGLWPRHRILSGPQSRPRISVLTYCFKYLKRFQRYLDSLVRQELPPGSLEIVVGDPDSPDGLKSYLEELAPRTPDVRLIHIPILPQFHRNRGICINRAFDVCSGQTIISTDGDILFPPTLIKELANYSEQHPDLVLGVRRHFLNRTTTEEVLDGRLDPHTLYDRPLEETGDGEPESREGILGYCQVVQRQAFARTRYPEEFDRVNQSDIEFVSRLARYASVAPRFFENCKVYHLWHPRDWSGTQEML